MLYLFSRVSKKGVSRELSTIQDEKSRFLGYKRAGEFTKKGNDSIVAINVVVKCTQHVIAPDVIYTSEVFSGNTWSRFLSILIPIYEGRVVAMVETTHLSYYG